ncbi:MAG: MarR family transcriptional regulator [Desulfatiglans sp.]|jgi:DNA-binding MarR family transcriptional regulator|nr:MarR family transcriptional regulator [Desulfatiglans sp.]
MVMIKSKKNITLTAQSDFHFKYTKDIIYSIRRLMQAGELYTKELNKVYNISSAQLNCLLTLNENGSLPPSHIARLMMINSSTITGIIDRLEEKGLLKRMRISKDRRIITVELTKNGEVLAKNAPPPIQYKLFDGLSKLSENDIKNISDSLQKLTDMLDVQDLEVT